jgi:N-acetyl-anhydromuramyl-L-alanine amidase AmpD
MSNSAEYPDLPFVEPAAWGKGRDGKAVRYIVIHYTAGAERSTSAEDGAAYDRRRTDGTSTHYFVDQNSIVQCVLTKDRANAARHRGNRLGIQYELCGTAQTRAQWLDAASLATLKLAAKQVARDCLKYDIPARRLTVAETRAAWTKFPAGLKGIAGHVDVTNAYPEDGGDHTDPGTGFPWDVFLDLVQTELEIIMPLNEADKKWIDGTVTGRINAAVNALSANIESAISQIPTDVLAVKIVDKANPGRTVGDVLRDVAKLRGVLVGDIKDTANAAIPATAPISRVIAAAEETLTD